MMIGIYTIGIWGQTHDVEFIKDGIPWNAWCHFHVRSCSPDPAIHQCFQQTFVHWRLSNSPDSQAWRVQEASGTCLLELLRIEQALQDNILMTTILAKASVPSEQVATTDPVCTPSSPRQHSSTQIQYISRSSINIIHQKKNQSPPHYAFGPSLAGTSGGATLSRLMPVCPPLNHLSLLIVAADTDPVPYFA